MGSTTHRGEATKQQQVGTHPVTSSPDGTGGQAPAAPDGSTDGPDEVGSAPEPRPADGKVGSIAELRRICQDPVRQYNDLTGVLYGWRFSIYITRALLARGYSASVGSVAMVVAGLLGSTLCLFGGVGLPIGLFLLTLAYVLDCVDGEMARYQGIDSYRWAAVDYLHHMFTKGLSFAFLGVGLYVEYGVPWTMAAGGLCSVFWLLLMGVRDLPTALFAKKIVLSGDRRKDNPAYQRMLRYMEELPDDALCTDDGVERWGKDFKFEPWVIRTAITSFDMIIPAMMFAAIADLFVAPFALFGVGGLSLVSLLVFAYAVILPLHTVDLIRDSMSKSKQVRNELYELAASVERYRQKQ